MFVSVVIVLYATHLLIYDAPHRLETRFCLLPTFEPARPTSLYCITLLLPYFRLLYMPP